MHNGRIASICGHGTALLLLIIYLVVSSAFAEPRLNSTSSFTIPPQPLPSALLRYAEQSGVQVTSSAALVENRQSRGVVGNFDARTALAKILEGTALGFEAIDEHSVVILPERASLKPRRDEKRAASASGRRTASHENEVVVTGSHIRGFRANPSLVFSFDREDFARAGSSTLQEFIRTVPQNFQGGRTEASGALLNWRNGGRDNIAHGAGINIRGLGNESTLVLINGRRFGAGGFGNFFDVSTFPLSAVERVEVLADGTSAIYGSDAVGGVVNFVLRDNFDGAETALRYGGVTDGDLREFAANQLLGTSWNRGSLLINVDYGERDALRATEREYAIGLWGGTNILLPKEKRLSTLLRSKQEVTDSLSISIDAYANDRESQNHMYQSATQNQIHSNAETEQFGGIAELIWKASNGWEVALAHSYSQSDTTRDNNLGTRHTGVRSDLGLSVSDVKIHGNAFHAPGGMSQVAIGLERRHESLDSARLGLVGRPTTSLARTVDAAFAELYVPVVAADDDERRTLVELTGALRYEDFSDFGPTDNAKIAATWSPVRNFNIHATWGTSFRAPSLFLYDDSQSLGGVFSVRNPDSPTGTTVLAVAGAAPRPDLGAETATTWTAGISVNSFDKVRFSAAYFRIDYDNRITTPGVSLNAFLDPAQRPLISMPPDADVLEFVRTARQYANLTTRDLADVDATLDGRTNNRGDAQVSGIDFMVANDIRTSAGHLDLSLSANYFLSFETQAINDAPPVYYTQM